MQCVILAGGLGTRLRSVSTSVPKALVPVAGRPFADHQLSWLAGEGVTDVVYCIGHLGALIRDFVGDGMRWGLRVEYVDEGGSLLGTAGAIRLAYDEGALEPAFGVLYGDSYLAAPLRNVWEAFAALRPAALMTVYRNEGRYDASNARLEGDWVVQYEKGLRDPAALGMHHIDYGYSILDRDAVAALLRPRQPIDLADVLAQLSAAGELAGYEVRERFFEVGSPAGLAELQARLAAPAGSEEDDVTETAIRPDAIELLIPEDDVDEPELSIVIPALNEALTITDFVTWCRQGLVDAGVRGEILIVDSSTDETAQLAVAAGARVLRVPKRGLGRAYLDAIPSIRGQWLVMGDADCTYDFRRLRPFVQRFREGYEFVMGSRWKGSIEPGAMPPLHQYLGTPVTTWILNRLYSSRFSDIHCGMRGITRDALVRMDLHSQSWEYASEMVLKSVHMELRTTEVPVTFLKDREGRLSHHKRSGWFSPWSAAWINLRAMFVYGSDFFVLKPGLILAILGLLITLPVSFGNVDLGPVALSLNWQFLGLVTLVIGLQGFSLGVIAQVLFDYTGRRRRRWLRLFPYTRTVLTAFALVVVGVALAIPLLVAYIGRGLALSEADALQNHLAVTGLATVVIGAQLFAFTLLLHGTIVATTRGRPRTAAPD